MSTATPHARRIVVCYDIKGGRVVKGTSFVDLDDQGDPAALVAGPAAEGADEVVFLDIDGSPEGRPAFLATVGRAAQLTSAPVVIGGGVRSLSDVEGALDAGASKVAINSAIVRDPTLLNAAAAEFGSERIVAAIDAKRVERLIEFEVFVAGGMTGTGLAATEWARECGQRGAGEVLLTSVDRDGQRDGFDLALTQAVALAAGVPVVASGGAGSAAHFVELFRTTAAAGGLAAGMFHDGTITARQLKRELAAAGLAEFLEDAS